MKTFIEATITGVLNHKDEKELVQKLKEVKDFLFDKGFDYHCQIKEEVTHTVEKANLDDQINRPPIDDIPRCCGKPLEKGHCIVCGDNYNDY